MLRHLLHFPRDVPHHLPLPAMHGLPHKPHITAPCTYTEQLLARLWSCSDKPPEETTLPGSRFQHGPVSCPSTPRQTGGLTTV